jgi:hypothetical protein
MNAIFHTSQYYCNTTIFITRKNVKYFRCGVNGFSRTDDSRGEAALGTTIILRDLAARVFEKVL